MTVSFTMKRCTKCAADRPLSSFHNDKNRKDGRFPWCTGCTKESLRAWYEKNREKVIEKSLAYHFANRISRLAQQKTWRIRNPERAKELQKNRNKAVARAGEKAWRQRNIEIVRAHSKARKARKRAAVGKYTGAELLALLGKQRNKCAACKTKLERYHADHIVPLVSGGQGGIGNIQILCPPCNLSKGRKMPDQFMRERGFLL